MANYNVECWINRSAEQGKPKRGPDRNLFIEADDPETAIQAMVVYFDLEKKREEGRIFVQAEIAGAIGIPASEILSSRAAEPASASTGSRGGGSQPMKVRKPRRSTKRRKSKQIEETQQAQELEEFHEAEQVDGP